MSEPKDLDWTPEETVLALDIYHRYNDEPDRGERIVRLSRDLGNLDVYPKALHLDNHRSTAAVGMLFQKFKSMETNGQTSSREIAPAIREVWTEYGGRRSATKREADRVRGAHLPKRA